MDPKYDRFAPESFEDFKNHGKTLEEIYARREYFTDDAAGDFDRLEAMNEDSPTFSCRDEE